MSIVSEKQNKAIKLLKHEAMKSDPQGMIGSEVLHHGEKLEEISEALGEMKEPVKKAFDKRDFLDQLLSQITPKKGRDYLPDEEIESIKKELAPVKGKDYFTNEEVQEIVNFILQRATPRKGVDYQENFPVKGVDYLTQEEIEDFLKQVTPVKGIHYDDGQPGKDGKSIGVDEEKIINAVLQKIPPAEKGEDAVLPKMGDLAKEVVKALKTLPEKDKLDISNLRNSAQIQSAIGKINSLKEGSGFRFNGRHYKFEELMHGSGSGGGSSGGTDNALDFETPTQIPNGSIVDFTVTNIPLYVIADNQTYFKNEGYTLTGSGPYNISLDVAPFSYVRSANASPGNLAYEAPTQTPNGVITSFTFQNLPKYIISDNQAKFEDYGYVITGSGPYTVTVDVPPFGFVKSIYVEDSIVGNLSGAVNGSNVTFTASKVPLYIIADNQTYFEGNGYTISGLTITMDAAPWNFIKAIN